MPQFLIRIDRLFPWRIKTLISVIFVSSVGCRRDRLLHDKAELEKKVDSLQEERDAVEAKRKAENEKSKDEVIFINGDFRSSPVCHIPTY